MPKFRLLTTIALVSVCITAHSQDSCSIRTSGTPGIAGVTVADLRCLAKNTKQRQVLAMTFAAWCTPCKAHLPGAIAFAEANGLELVVVIPEAERDPYTAQAAAIVQRLDSSIRTVVISDTYGTERGPKYKRFLREVIPPAFPMIDDYSKYILFDKSGAVVFVSSWKDNRKNNWKSDTAVQNQRIRPLLLTGPR